MKIQEFADKYRVNTSRDECGESFIRGRTQKRWDSRYPDPTHPSELGLGQIYQHSADGALFGVVFMPRKPLH